MKSFITIIAVLIAGISFVLNIKTDSLSYRTKKENQLAQSDGSVLEKLIRKLRDKELRESSPKEFVSVINKARLYAGANTFSDKRDEFPKPKLYSRELLSALIELLDWEAPKRTDYFDSSYGQPSYPAVYAIAVMGIGALPDLTSSLEREDKDSLKFQNALESIHFIQGRDEVATIEYLRKAARRSRTAKGRRTLLFGVERISQKVQ